MDDFLNRKSSDWQNSALLHYPPGASHWHAYILGYKEAADRLVQTVMSGQRGNDFLVYPILFLYRHWVEIFIKSLILQAQALSGIEPPPRSRRMTSQGRSERAEGHNLEHLWNYLLKITPEIYPGFSRPDVEAVDRVVAVLAKHDLSGDAARYPLDMAQNPTLNDLQEINLRILAEEMDAALSGFYELEGAFDYEIELRSLTYEYYCQFTGDTGEY